ncbi:hypothetical protein PPL_03812 [Heterostelium album PN500]|uniref:AMP-dependent synthetase/ligase domain-containing protein n=1 Tax=Heterostelium pallidum (strain ATCC 26659 / Pp 5 / PN500) TaxID=670386 RepID=D3B6Q7_HETP5|nr:hypothetical protein PPL_03812 [Heterostelium album PN500]EFA83027.1 hypothetical protein PPL_03812 [Heterostelium album PN500]|eukprot:XP_020435144.1 hypothetical protein PPL_03812 [Heterostelium album PN500]
MDGIEIDLSLCGFCRDKIEPGVERYRCSECVGLFLCTKCYHSPQSNLAHTDKAPLPHFCNIETKSDINYWSFIKCDTVYQSFVNSFTSFSKRRCIGVRNENSTTNPINWLTYEEIYDKSQRFGTSLTKYIPRESKVGTMLESLPEWYYVEFACLYYGFTMITINQHLNKAQLPIILNNGEPSVLVVSKYTLPRLIDVIDQYSKLTMVVHVGDEFDENLISKLPQNVQFKMMSELIDQTPTDQIGSHSPLVDGILALVYSSGSTGIPKGQIQTNRQLLNVLQKTYTPELYFLTMSFLSLSHAQRIFDLCTILNGGKIVVYRSTNLDSYLKDVIYIRPTYFWGLPSFWNQFYTRYQYQLQSIKDNNPQLSELELKELAINESRSMLGDRVQLVVTGGSVISQDILHFMKDCWADKVINLYGSTECYHITVNDVLNPDVQHKIIPIPEHPNSGQHPVGELVVLSPRVIKGYYRNEEANICFQDGWFYTGDIVEEYEPRKIRILDRVKNSFKGPQAKYVCPETIESYFYTSSLIRNIFLYGDSYHEFLVAIVIPSDEALERFNASIKDSNLNDNVKLRNYILEDIKLITNQKSIAFWESPRVIKLDNTIWSPENNLYTGTSKMDQVIDLLTSYLEQPFDEQNDSSNINNPTYDILLAPLKVSTLDQISSIATNLIKNEPIMQLIIKKICSKGFAQTKNELLCQWFYTWYNLESITAKRFVLAFVPAFLWVFLYGPSPTTHIGIETCMIGIYNHELVDREGNDNVFQPVSVTMPSFIFKSVTPDAESALTESTLKQLNLQSVPVMVERALTRIDAVTTANRTQILRTNIKVYNANLTYMPEISRTMFCEMCIRVSATGYPFLPLAQDSPSQHHHHNNNNNNNNINEQSSSSLASMVKSSDALFEESAPLSQSENLIERQRKERESRKQFRMTSYLELDYQLQSHHNQHLTNGNGNTTHQHTTITTTTTNNSKIVKRLYITESVYRELITGLTYCAFQDSTKSMATIALKSINQRASHDLVPEIMLYSNSVINVLQHQHQN